MRHYVAVKVEQDKNKSEGQVGKAEFLTNFSQSPETKRVKQKHLKDDELINIQESQQQELRRDKSIGNGQVTLRIKYAELHRRGSMQRQSPNRHRLFQKVQTGSDDIQPVMVIAGVLRAI